jgi:hypothetical protein
MQELLNRTDAHLWAVLTNGRQFRLLRDNIVMGRPAYVEFDLEGMFDGEQFADFAVMFALAHATRFAAPAHAASSSAILAEPDDTDAADEVAALPEDSPAACILEHWRNTVITDGTRALKDLRYGVLDALTALGLDPLDSALDLDMPLTSEKVWRALQHLDAATRTSL